MKHLSKFESFDMLSDDPMEKVTLREYSQNLKEKHLPFTQNEMQRITDFCNKMGFKIQARPKEIVPEVKKSRLDRFKDYVTSKFVTKKEESGPEVRNEFIINIPADHESMERLRDKFLLMLQNQQRRWSRDLLGYVQLHIFKTNEDYFYMQFIVGARGPRTELPPAIRDFYRFDELRTFFKFVEDLIKG
jgi:hypothetical protein